MLNFMKQLIQVRKEISSIIQYGINKLEEVKPDILSLKWSYEGKEVQAIFNQSKENFVLDRYSVDLASHCQVKEGQQIILPDGFVVYISE